MGRLIYDVLIDGNKIEIRNWWDKAWDREKWK